ncbi:MAG: thiamine phosphate synthase, partial [Candidatus Krumholzibacteriia bacterium]
ALLALAAGLREVTAERRAALYINDRIDVALAVGADGAHCPEAGFPPRDARRLLGPDRAVGASTHSVEGARQAFEGDSDFVTFGPVFTTPSKSAWGAPQGLDALGRVCEAVGRPVYAVGGVTPDRAAACLQRGAAGVAVVSAIMAARDIERVVNAFESALGRL